MVMAPAALPRETSTIDFRAPPPSPIASDRRSSLRNEDVLSEFLENSLKVPDLILPDRVFPRQKSVQKPPELDFRSLSSLEHESISKLIDSVGQIGCFEVINHGISEALVKSVLVAAEGIFAIPLEKRKAVTRSLERPCGFEEVHGEEEREMSEEFVWSGDEGLKMDMEGIWPLGYSNFSDEMEKLFSGFEDVAAKILLFLQQNCLPVTCNYEAEDQEFGSVCYLHKHHEIINGDQALNSLGYDVIRMVIRGSEFPHAMCLHVCNGSEEFHIYSKKGWISFHPNKDSLVITIGDKLQAWSGGQYKHVIGRPMFKGVDQDSMLLAFVYSPQMTNLAKSYNGQSISVNQQIIVVIVLSLFFHLMVCISNFYKQWLSY